MQRALAVADRAEREHDEVPVGAVLVSQDGELLAEGWNLNISEHDPSAHAEIVALRAAGADAEGGGEQARQQHRGHGKDPHLGMATGNHRQTHLETTLFKRRGAGADLGAASGSGGR